MPKLLSRVEGRSPLKYIMSVFLSKFEYFTKKNSSLSTRVWVSILGVPKLLPRGQILGTNSATKCYHVGTLEAVHFCTLATILKLVFSVRKTNCYEEVIRFLLLIKKITIYV